MTDQEEDDSFRQIKTEVQEGREIGAELFNLARDGQLSRDEYIAKMSALTPAQRIGAQEVMSAVLGIGEALRRIEEGAATIDLDLKPDASGYFDRRCPSSECGAYFKIFFDDWKNKDFKEVRCPICGHRADHNLFDTPTQREHVEFRGQKLVEREVGRELPGIPFEVTPADRAIPRDVAIKIEQLLERGAQCDACGCRYAARTHPFFCPACGHRNALFAFKTEVETIRQALDSIPWLRTQLTQTIGQQAAESLIQHRFVEASFSSLVGAFQSAAEAAFHVLPNPLGLVPRKNQFQNLRESSELWKRATGRDFAGMLPASEWQELQRLFQQRHKLAHTGGIVDQDYLTRTGDTRYAVGDRIVVTEASVLRLSELVSKLVTELQK